MSARSVSFVARGPDGNLGDVLLRRAFIQALRSWDAPIHVFVGQASREFIDGLELDSSDVVHRSKLRFFGAQSCEIIRGRHVVVANTGELRGSWKQVANLGTLALLAAIARLRGGAALISGVSFVPTAGFLVPIFRVLFRLFGTITWRDQDSQDMLKLGSVAPDWGFSLRPLALHPAERSNVLVSLRGDRPRPSAAYIKGLRDLSDELGCQLVVACQVKEDRDACIELARSLSAELLDWPVELSHRTQEDRLRGAMSRSRLIISDRLHVLVLGLVEGAPPVSVHEYRGTKMVRHFKVVGEFPGIVGYAEGDVPAVIVAAGRGAVAEADRAQSSLRDADEYLMTLARSFSNS